MSIRMPMRMVGHSKQKQASITLSSGQIKTILARTSNRDCGEIFTPVLRIESIISRLPVGS